MFDFSPKFFTYLLVMAGITYLVRMLPIILFRRKIESRFIRSFLYYMPYTVLSVMTVPAIFFSTGHILSACVGALAAVLVALRKHSLITVAAVSAFSVLVLEFILLYIPIAV